MIKILFADDNPTMQENIRDFIAAEPDMVVAGRAETGRLASELACRDEWDVVLLDLTLPDQSGVETLKEIRRCRPLLPVLIVSGFPESQYGTKVIRAGANGYLAKERIPEELVPAIRAVAQGQNYLSSKRAHQTAETQA
ncbi:MAG: response regulator transcription factor [Betaproteobacteria bacterium]|nr:response regulator transcription factor [Betaproteobacteria bacterium]MBA3776368.1 response regulator transcription factor [Betaproteobacteria bacterium]